MVIKKLKKLNKYKFKIFILRKKVIKDLFLLIIIFYNILRNYKKFSKRLNY